MSPGAPGRPLKNKETRHWDRRCKAGFCQRPEMRSGEKNKTHSRSSIAVVALLTAVTFFSLCTVQALHKWNGINPGQPPPLWDAYNPPAATNVCPLTWPCMKIAENTGSKPAGLETLTGMCHWPSGLCARGELKIANVFGRKKTLVFQKANCWTAQPKGALSQKVTKNQFPELTGLCEPVNIKLAAWKQWVTFDLLTYFRPLDSWRTLQERQWCIWKPEFKNLTPKFASQTISCSNYGLTIAEYFFARQVALHFVLRRQSRRRRSWEGPLCVTCNNKALQHRLWGAEAPQELCWSKWQQELWRVTRCQGQGWGHLPGHQWHLESRLLLKWDLSRCLLARAGASWPSRCPWRLLSLLEHHRYQKRAVRSSPLQLTVKMYRLGQLCVDANTIVGGTGFPIPQGFMFSPPQEAARIFTKHATNTDILP